MKSLVEMIEEFSDCWLAVFRTAYMWMKVSKQILVFLLVQLVHVATIYLIRNSKMNQHKTKSAFLLFLCKLLQFSIFYLCFHLLSPLLGKGMLNDSLINFSVMKWHRIFQNISAIRTGLSPPPSHPSITTCNATGMVTSIITVFW